MNGTMQWMKEKSIWTIKRSHALYICYNLDPKKHVLFQGGRKIEWLQQPGQYGRSTLSPRQWMNGTMQGCSTVSLCSLSEQMVRAVIIVKRPELNWPLCALSELSGISETGIEGNLHVSIGFNMFQCFNPTKAGNLAYSIQILQFFSFTGRVPRKVLPWEQVCTSSFMK